MRIDLAAFNAHGNPAVDNQQPRLIPVVNHGYPKSEPVLESSYLFPKVVDCYGIWTYSAPGTVAVPANR